MNVCVLLYAVLHFEGTELETGVQEGEGHLGGEARKGSGELRVAEKDMQMHLKFFLLKKDLYARSLGRPLGCSKSLISGLFWSPGQRSRVQSGSQQPDSPFCTWHVEMHMMVVGRMACIHRQDGMGQMVGCLP